MANRITNSISMKYSKRNRIFTRPPLRQNNVALLFVFVYELMFVVLETVAVVVVVDAVAVVFVCLFGIDGLISVTQRCSSDVFSRYLLVLSSVDGTAFSHSTESSSLALKIRFNWNEMLIY